VDYLKQELELKERIIIENDNWAIVVPFWAILPFETLLLSKRHVLRLPELAENK
jgi:UDPglucose--hexose-1-phosphate uridylyltransferase